ncbi:tail protein X [Amorphus sp. MBR-141]
MQTYRTQQGDTVDLIAWTLRKRTRDLTEAILDANPGLADMGPILPEGLEINIPDNPPETPLDVRRLWS